MSQFKRVSEVIKGLMIALFGVILMCYGYMDETKLLVVIVICFYLLFSGLHLLWFYLHMAKHMVGGKRVLIRSVITLDLSLATISMLSMSNITILIYLLSIFAFSGAIDILRALESKKNGGQWKFKLTNGIIYIVYSIVLIIAGIFLSQTDFLIEAFGASLIYSACIRIFSAFRKTAIVYIQ